jgi:hypothetical protein
MPKEHQQVTLKNMRCRLMTNGFMGLSTYNNINRFRISLGW